MANELRRNVQLLRGVSTILGVDRSDDGVVAVADQFSVAVDPWERPEFAICRGEFLFCMKLNIGAGGAGTRSVAQVHNDSADALLVVSPGSYFWAASAPVQLSRSNILATTDLGLIAQALDGRFSRAAVPYVRLRSQNGAALPAGISNGIFFETNTLVAGTMVLELKFSIILRPGATLSVIPGVDNQQVGASFVGHVRRLATSDELMPSA